jgi:hypothetical protein
MRKQIADGNNYKLVLGDGFTIIDRTTGTNA